MTEVAEALAADTSVQPVLRPYLRHRLVVEQEAVDALIGAHGFAAIRRQVEELCLESYARGWLERHPVVLRRYISDLHSIRLAMGQDPALSGQHEKAVTGRTGIACFDTWAHEITTTGIICCARARAFASIWVFTLKLPWQLGVSFFLQHLVGSDIAGILMQWRRLAGVEIGSEPYILDADEIARLSSASAPRAQGLAVGLPDIKPEPPYSARPLKSYPEKVDAGPVVLLVTSDDLFPESWPVSRDDVRGALFIEPFDLFEWHSEKVLNFKRAGLDDASRRVAAYFDCPVERLRREDGHASPLMPREVDRSVREWFDSLGAVNLLTMAPTMAGAQDEIAAACQRLSRAREPARLMLLRRAWDAAFWELAGGDEAGYSARLSDTLGTLGIDCH